MYIYIYTCFVIPDPDVRQIVLLVREHKLVVLLQFVRIHCV